MSYIEISAQLTRIQSWLVAVPACVAGTARYHIEILMPRREWPIDYPKRCPLLSHPALCFP